VMIKPSQTKGAWPSLWAWRRRPRHRRCWS
jgi:hypothetical protein